MSGASDSKQVFKEDITLGIIEHPVGYVMHFEPKTRDF
jgi:hypothetical protein